MLVMAVAAIAAFYIGRILEGYSQGIVSGKSAPHPMTAPPAGKASPEEAVQFMRELKTFIEKNTDDVGPRFAEEALKIHYEEADARSIRGEATRDELQELRDEGVEVFPLPILPDDHN
jgi:hypothetical protein